MKLGLLFSSSLLVALAACSSSGGGGAQTPAPGPTSPGAPGPVACGVGSHKTDDGACESTLSIRRSAQQIAPARDHHVSIVAETKAGTFLYVFGGTSGWRAMYTDIQRAKIGDDGELGAFEKVGQLPAGRAGHCGVLSHGTFILVGGTVGTPEHPAISNTTVSVKLNDDGSLGAIADGPKLPLGIMHGTCDQKNDWLYVSGGRGPAGVSIDQVVRAKIAPDGTIAAFEKLGALSPDRSHHASVIRGDYLYLIGGLTGDPAGKNSEHKDLVRAKIDESGGLGAWEPAGNLSRTLSVSAAQLFNDRVYVFGGLYAGDSYTDAIQVAGFDESGSLLEFTQASVKLSNARAHVHQLPVHGRNIYSVGGLGNDEVDVGTVDIGTFE